MSEGKEYSKEMSTDSTVTVTADEMKKAFGGCEKCYGKGYATQIRGEEMGVNTCTCERGKQIDSLLEGVRKGLLHRFVAEMEGNLPEYIEETYPKGKKNSKERGPATVHITKFLADVKKSI